MTKFIIGDEEFSEEINTSYDQNQPIGDTPSDYPAGGAEPIDAQTGDDFLDIEIGGENWKDVANTIYNEEKKKLKKKGNEKLNQDGTGTANARRGIDPNNEKHVVMKFDYVSQSGCDVCAYYDEMSFGRDSPNRPVIPRLESGDGTRPYTHPNCKCRWTKVFTGSEVVDPALMTRAEKWYGTGWNELDSIEQKLTIIKMLKNSLSQEANAEEFDFMDPVPIASMAKLVFDTIKPVIAGEAQAFLGQRGDPHKYGIQNMLGDIVENSLSKDKKKDIEKKVNKDFTLDNLLNLTAQALADKLAKKLGVESIAKEGGQGSGKKGHQPWFLGAELGKTCPTCMIITEYDEGKCMICGNE